MDTWVWFAIAFFVVADGVVTFLVLRHVRRKKRREAAGGTDDLARQIGLDQPPTS